MYDIKQFATTTDIRWPIAGPPDKEYTASKNVKIVCSSTNKTMSKTSDALFCGNSLTKKLKHKARKKQKKH